MKRFAGPGLAVAAFLFALSAASCGPMNAKPASSAAGTTARTQCDQAPGADGDAPSDDREAIQLTKKRHYLYFARTYNVRRESGRMFIADFALRGSSRDLNALSKDAKIAVTYKMERPEGAPPENPPKDPYKMTLTRQESGTYTGSFKFRHAGKCDFTVSISQEGGEADENAFTLAVHE
jgi:hypothetical protein